MLVQANGEGKSSDAGSCITVTRGHQRRGNHARLTHNSYAELFLVGGGHVVGLSRWPRSYVAQLPREWQDEASRQLFTRLLYLQD